MNTRHCLVVTGLLCAGLLAVACTKETPAPTPTTPPQPAAPAAAPDQPPKAMTVETAQPKPAAAAPTIADLPKVLGTIVDGNTATAAKGQLEAITQQLQTAKAAAPASATGAAKDALGGLGKLAGQAAAKLGVSADTVKQVATLLENPAIKAAIGPTLEKLQGLLQ